MAETPAAAATADAAVATPDEAVTTESPAPADAAPAEVISVEFATNRLKELAKLSRPNMDEHQARTGALSDEIRALRDKIEDIKRQMDEAVQARSGGRGELQEARTLMTQLKTERDALRAQLDVIQADRKASKAKVEAHHNKKRAMQAETKHTSVDDVDAEIRALEHRQQTVSMSLTEEKKLLKEVQMLKDSKKVVAQYGTQEEHMRGAQESHTAIREVEQKKWEEYKEAAEKVKAQHTVIEGLNKIRDAEPDPYKDLLEEKKALQTQVSQKITQQRDMHAEFRAANEAYGASIREQRKLKDVLYKAEQESRRAAWMERKRLQEEEEAKKIPYEEEMALCDQLTSYLVSNFLPKASATKEAVPATPTEAPPATDEHEGKTLVLKKRDEEDFWAGTGGSKGKKGLKTGRRPSAPAADDAKAKGKAKSKQSDIIVLALETIESFAMLALEAPGSKTAVPDAIEALKAKKQWYSEQPRGTVPKAGGDKRKDSTHGDSRNSATANGKHSNNRQQKDGSGGGKDAAGTSGAADKSGSSGNNSPTTSSRAAVKAPEITDEAFPSLPGTASAKDTAAAAAAAEDADATTTATTDETAASDDAEADSEQPPAAAAASPVAAAAPTLASVVAGTANSCNAVAASADADAESDAAAAEQEEAAAAEAALAAQQGAAAAEAAAKEEEEAAAAEAAAEAEAAKADADEEETEAVPPSDDDTADVADDVATETEPATEPADATADDSADADTAAADDE